MTESVAAFLPSYCARWDIIFFIEFECKPSTKLPLPGEPKH